MSLDKRFLVSVADAIVRDPDTKDIIMISKANISTGFEITLDSNEIAGGFNNQLQFVHYYNRRIALSIESSEWRKDFLASQVGVDIATRNDDVFKNECIMITSGAGTVTEDPTGNVTLINESGALLSITPSGRDLSGVSVADGEYTVIYMRNTQVEAIDIDAGTTPSILDVTLTIPEFNQSGRVGTLEIEIPRLSLNGNFTLNFTADGVSSSMLSGQTLAISDNECETGQVYAVVRFIPENAATLSLQGIVGLVNQANFVEAPAGSETTYQINTIGIRGAGYGNRPIPTSELTYAIESGGDADITVSNAGVITVAASGTANDAATVQITHSTQTSLKAEVNVDVV